VVIAKEYAFSCLAYFSVIELRAPQMH